MICMEIRTTELALHIDTRESFMLKSALLPPPFSMNSEEVVALNDSDIRAVPQLHKLVEKQKKNLLILILTAKALLSPLINPATFPNWYLLRNSRYSKILVELGNCIRSREPVIMID